MLKWIKLMEEMRWGREGTTFIKDWGRRGK
jgi:hypothetical protein